MTAAPTSPGFLKIELGTGQAAALALPNKRESPRKKAGAPRTSRGAALPGTGCRDPEPSKPKRNALGMSKAHGRFCTQRPPPTAGCHWVGGGGPSFICASPPAPQPRTGPKQPRHLHLCGTGEQNKSLREERRNAAAVGVSSAHQDRATHPSAPTSPHGSLPPGREMPLDQGLYLRMGSQPVARFQDVKLSDNGESSKADLAAFNLNFCLALPL